VSSSSDSLFSRRQFLKQSGLCGLTGLLSAKELGAFDGAAVSATPGISPSEKRPSKVWKNRAPLAANAFYFLPLGSIQPAAWLRRQLRIQADGLSGHLDETWVDVGPNSGWLGGSGESWERGPYFVDGLLPLAYLLDDAGLKGKAQRYIDWTLNNQWANGMFGPRSNDDWWPRIVMLKALTQYHELTDDARVIPFMRRYFAYQLSELPKRPLRDWGKFRWQDEVVSVLWLYNRAGDANLLALARLLQQQGYDWPAEFSDFKYTTRITSDYLGLNKGRGLADLALATHGVNNGQAVKTGPVWSQVSGSDSDRCAVLRMIAQLDKYHGLPNGMFSCDEHFAGLNPSQGSELCTVVEYMYSLEQSLAILGDPALGDRLERLAFNALPGAFSDDMWVHQYNQEPNQVECSLHREPWTTDGPESNLFGLEPNFGCCTANFHQGWPKFTNSLFMLSCVQGSNSNDGLVAVAYAPCEVSVTLRGTAVCITEETDYPFRGTVRMTVKTASSMTFPVQFRIPNWAEGASIKINGLVQPAPRAGTFAVVDHKWNSGDKVELNFPLQPRISRWFNDSVAVERGPLVFSYGIGEDWLKLRDRGMTADWQIYPTTQWNYGLDLQPASPLRSISVTENEISDRPFAKKNSPVRLHVNARKLPGWHAQEGVADPVPQSPVASHEPEETITLVPYAAAKLRITAFPHLEPDQT
jgi:hypothetical protein